MIYAIGLRCLRCGRQYGLGELEYVCGCRPNVGSDLGALDVLYDYAALRAEFAPASLLRDPDRSIAAFWPLLPLQHRSSHPTLAVGNTPLISAERLAQDAGLTTLWIKDDGRNPTLIKTVRGGGYVLAATVERG